MIAEILIPLCLWLQCPPPPAPEDPPALVILAETYQGMGDGDQDVLQWLPLVAGQFDEGEYDRALCLIAAESGGNPNARNPSSGASGLMQILPSWAAVYGVSRTDLFDPSINLYIAADLQDRYGWTQWSPYNRGECR